MSETHLCWHLILKWGVEVVQTGLEFDNFKPQLQISIFNCIVGLNGWMNQFNIGGFEIVTFPHSVTFYVTSWNSCWLQRTEHLHFPKEKVTTFWWPLESKISPLIFKNVFIFVFIVHGLNTIFLLSFCSVSSGYLVVAGGSTVAPKERDARCGWTEPARRTM
jgi:hypothetical protein